MGLDLNLRSRTRPRQLTNCSAQTPTARRSTSPRQWFDAGSSSPIAHCSTREWQIMLPDPGCDGLWRQASAITP
jgi:hypothetical protein